MNFPRPKVTTVLISIALFIFFFIILFPFQSLRGYIFQRIYKETGIVLVAEELYLSLLGWPGIGMKSVDATIPLGNGRDFEISSERVIARVGLGGLFPPAPSVSLYAKGLKKGGNFYAKVSQNKAYTKVYFEADGVNLEQLSTSGPGDAVQGKLSAEGDLYYDSNDLAKSQGKVEINAEKVKTPAQNLQGIILPQINFGGIKSKINIKNGVLEVNSFQLGNPGSDIQGSIGGEIRLGRDLLRSVLNITLKLQLSDAFRDNPNSATIVSLLNSIDNAKPGSYAMKWATSVEGITTNLWNALPKKVSQ